MIRQQLFDGKYRIITTLGKGGMGAVYLAQNVKLGTLWAIKQVNKIHHAKIDLLAEPNILKMLNHPALPRIFDIVEDDQSLYIIEDFIEGVSLEKELEANGVFPESKVVVWAMQLCDVLHYLHTFKPNPIIFRDLKPANIILNFDGQIKLIDFGVAREYKAQAINDTTYMGTRGYAAPEQYGIGQTDARTDIYSFGVTLYHLLTGKSPNQPPYEIRPVRELNNTLSKEIEYIISTCTQQNPDKRFQSVLEIQRLLNQINGQKRYSNNSFSGRGFNHIGKEDIAETQIPDTELLPGLAPNHESLNAPGNSLHPVVFNRLVLTIWGNAEFAAELAYIAAKHSDLNIVLTNLDFVSQKVDYYLNIRDIPNNGLDTLLCTVGNTSLTMRDFENACIRKDDADNLYVLLSAYHIGNYEKYQPSNVAAFIEYAYQLFDMTILIVNQSIFDPYTLTALLRSDYNIVPIVPNADTIREFRCYCHYLFQKYSMPMKKVKYVAYEYKKGINPPESALKNELGKDNYIGYVSYQSQRETCRNYNTVFAKQMSKQYEKEYMDILAHFNIVPKKTLGKQIKEWLKARIIDGGK